MITHACHDNFFHDNTYLPDLSTICTLYAAKVEKEVKQSSLLLQIMAQITTPTATKSRCSMLNFGKSLVWIY